MTGNPAERWASEAQADRDEPEPGRPRYSPDRLSLAQEIAETLTARGLWTPKEWAGPDLITAIGVALDREAPPTAAAVRAWIAARLAEAEVELTPAAWDAACGRLHRLTDTYPLDDLDGQLVGRSTLKRWQEARDLHLEKPARAGAGWKMTTRAQRRAAVCLASTSGAGRRLLVAYPKDPQPTDEGEDDG